MYKYKQLNLKDNPFADLSPSLDQTNANNLTWAALPDLKQTLETVHRQALNATPRQVILNWGTVGAGKTYAAYYFSSEERLKTLEPSYKGDIYWLCINTPKEGNNATQELFQSIIDGGFSSSQIQKQIRLRMDHMGQEALLNFLARRIKSEEFAKAVLLLGHQDPEIVNLLTRYLHGSATNTDLKKLGLARPLKTTGSFAKILAAILLCFVTSPNGTQKGRLFLWLDETEDLLFFTAKQYRLFAQFLRELIDHVNEGMTIFLNSTLAEPDQNTIRLLFGEALWSRINHKIRFNELSLDEALLYCDNLLQTFQLEDKGAYHPFDEEALRLLLDMPQDLMIPREINKRCSQVLTFALQTKKTIISKEVIKSFINHLES